jgi:hypothetical protein
MVVGGGNSSGRGFYRRLRVSTDAPVALRVPISRIRETAALTLALCSLLLGLLHWKAYLPEKCRCLCWIDYPSPCLGRGRLVRPNLEVW